MHIFTSIKRSKVESDDRFEARWKEVQLQRRLMVDKACAAQRSKLLSFICHICPGERGVSPRFYNDQY